MIRCSSVSLNENMPLVNENSVVIPMRRPFCLTKSKYTWDESLRSLVRPLTLPLFNHMRLFSVQKKLTQNKKRFEGQ